MSASLVGSEMCIRDSASTRAVACAGTRAGTREGTHAQALAKAHTQTHVPVSYTHLTLPTICSV
eukprot:8921787-Alexandrium_andersonii.AAC.1